MIWILVGGAILCGWAMLRTMGSERERRIAEQRLLAAPPPPPVKPPASPHKVPSKWQQSHRSRQAA
ncbi:MAG TPA: hypothetical protein VGR35_08020 [Tepidisphaeraceae bacterium]|nr:hypothetical protein [Tepidisphaeraceae bacterium]